LQRRLRDGELDEKIISIEVNEKPSGPMMEVLGASGLEEMVINMRDALGNLGQGMGGKKREKRMKVVDALALLVAEESERRIDMETVVQQAL
ncbi:MAG: hypothetical protein KC549_05475, partial [Myxococcales bacterium]|nr:hypothetical protein [Myxococcales bacterium]